jgi:hypothetical protein
MVVAVVRTPFDRLGKQMVSDAVEGRCSVESDAEVPASTRRIDLWISPHDDSPPPPAHLGLIGQITRRAATIEFFHNTPSGEDLLMCLVKHTEFRFFLSRRKTLPALPMQWVISAGRPEAGIKGLSFVPRGELRGIYEAPPLFCTRLVVVNELPVASDTLLVRLLGAGSVLKQAIAELRDLPPESAQRRLAMPILLRLQLTVPIDPAQQTSDDQEFWESTRDLVDRWEQDTIQRGLAQGVQQGERNTLLRQLRRRFGAEINPEIEQRVADAPIAQIELWLDRVLAAVTLAELLAD